MSLAEEYARQFAFRDWETALAACPIEAGQKILDLGCGAGDLSAELVKRGTQVVGVDIDESLLSLARKRDLKDCIFLKKEISSLDLQPNSFDGIWCSFTSAYFANFEIVLRSWIPLLKKKSWICVVEMDDLLGHEPMNEVFHKRIDAFYSEALALRRYDFRAGHKVSAIMKNQGLKVHEQLLRDQELSFDGPANSAVLKAWADRFDRMVTLKNFFGEDFDSFQTSFLESMASQEHRSKCRVFCVVGTRS